MSLSSLIEKFQDKLPLVSPREVSLLEKYHSVLLEWNQKISLVSRASIDRAFPQHFADSLWMSEHCRPFVRKEVADIGSGAGFPGVVFAIRYPEITVKLYETMAKRQVYLKELLKSLSLTNLSSQGKWEKRGGADFYFARAVLPPTELLAWMERKMKLEDRICLNLGSVRKEFTVPRGLKLIHQVRYELPATEGFREIEIYEAVPRGT